MARRDFLPPMDGVGQPRIWRAAIYFLSAALVDAGGGAELCGSLECGAGSFHCRRANDGGNLRVFAGAPISPEKRGAFWSGVLRGESVCAADCLHAQRFCGATGVRADAAGVADGDGTLRASGESPWLAFAGHGALRISVRDGCACGKIAAAVVARRGWTGTGVWIDKFLSFAGGV